MKLATRYFNKKVKKEKEKDSLIENQRKDAKRIEEEVKDKDEEEEEEKKKHGDASENENIALDANNTTHKEWTKKMTTLYHFIHQIIMIFCRQCDNTESQSVQFFLMAGQNAIHCGFEETAFELYLDAFRIYEDAVSHSRAQFNAIVYSIGSLLKSSPRFQERYFNTLSTKLTLYSTKLLKKPDQSRAVYHASHLWAQGETPSRVIECLQKSLKIADSCMDTVTNEILFLELLNQYIYYYEQEQPLVSFFFFFFGTE